jgi:hypothetical protein
LARELQRKKSLDQLSRGLGRGRMTEREQAWEELLAAKPDGWWVGTPSEHPERGEWLLYAFDPAERPKVGLRSREWTSIAPTEIEVVREMARCLREIAAGRVPR